MTFPDEEPDVEETEDDEIDWSEVDLDLECEKCSVMVSEGVRENHSDGYFYCSIECLSKSVTKPTEIYFTVTEILPESEYSIPALTEEFRYKRRDT